MAKKHLPAVSEKIAPAATEISVAKSGFLKPYMTLFQALPDNIAREPLGMLSGIFLIGDRSESSAYIVNFLASLAKKEYYANPRRPAIESFEASLHKINLGLSELAKEGNTEWIGTLDAALCAIEKNNLHFSVAGKARVLLIRENRLSVVSDGLVEEGEIHPMKTFTDVASGKICSGDRILLTTPELFSALSEIELERSAARLSNEHLERLLQTAVVNRLDLSANILIDVRTIEEYTRPEAPKRAVASEKSIPNAWSLSAFEASKRTGTSVQAELRERKEADKERIDNKTGHIYVTGETPEERPHETSERLASFLDEFRRGWHRVKRSLHYEFGAFAHALQTRYVSWREERRENGRVISASTNEKHHPSSKESETSPLSPPEKITEQLPEAEKSSTVLFVRIASTLSAVSRTTRSLIRETIPNSLPLPSRFRRTESKLIHVPIRDDAPRFRNRFSSHLSFWKRKLLEAFAFWKSLSPEYRKRVGIASGIGALICIIIAATSLEPSPASQEPALIPQSAPPPPAPSPAITEKNLRFITAKSPILMGESVLDIARVNGTFFAVTPRTIIRIDENGAPSERTTVPIQSDIPLSRAVSMPDLGAILLFSNADSLLFYTPSNGRFSEQSLALPPGKGIADIEAYTTYLYLALSSDRTLLRSARIEGGFAPGISWLKEPSSVQSDTRMAIREFVYLADTGGLRVYSRGIRQPITFEIPGTPPIFSDIALSEDDASRSLYALDGSFGRIIEYDRETGSIQKQYASELLKGGTRLAVESRTKTAYAITQNGVVTVPIE